MVYWRDADFNLTYITRTELNTRRFDKPVGLSDQKGSSDLGELSPQPCLIALLSTIL